MNRNPISHPSSEALALEKSYRLNDIVKQREKTLSRLNLKAGEKVLDLGCGVGFLAQDMAKIVGESGLVICLSILLILMRLNGLNSRANKTSYPRIVPGLPRYNVPLLPGQ